ncbi:retinaldehyde-binding protein 1-like [Toxorhynchites rutilus septentrionalis]|uniref:retinaldehyde-binding protein 1-like n=1 Tax=Toxorhynchites rutilus septentrionalis TaxID=329112 RepID=UPI00247A5BAE|nr:retinaldehyde-binding protein 1-like [Toxorhynchites rutilus septentrionalis]
MDRKFDIDASPPTPELLEIARNELRETPEVREAAIKELRRLLAEATDLCYKDDDDFLLIFLRPCHFYPESAIKLMRRIAEFKKYYHDLLHNLMPEDEKVAFCDHKVVNVLTNLDQKGRRVLVVNCGSLWDPKQISSNQLFRMFYLIHVVAQLEPSSQINGVVVIMDFDGLSLKQATALSPSFSKLLLTFIQEALPLRLKEVHIVKQPFIFKMVWKLFTPFIKEKLNKRMFFHGSDMKKFHQYLSADVLPENYGGNLPAIDYSGKDWYPCVDKYIDHIRKYNECGFAEKSEK